MKELNALLRTANLDLNLNLDFNLDFNLTANSHLGNPGCPGRAYSDGHESRYDVPSSGYRLQTMSKSA